MPDRIQLRRSKGWRKPADAIVCTRPGRFGNPFKGPDAVDRFRASLAACLRSHARRSQPVEMRRIVEQLEQLRGHDLCCFCPLDKPCHVDVLLEVANR